RGGGGTMGTSQLRFIRQQGFSARVSDERLYTALMFQPKIVGGVVIIGVCFQNAWVFLGLSSLLWWSAVAPARNVFDAIYNVVVATPRGLPRLGPAPAPRRFAMGMAGTITLIIGSTILLDMSTTAWILEGIFIAAVASVVFGRFCVGSYLFNLL